MERTIFIGSVVTILLSSCVASIPPPRDIVVAERPAFDAWTTVLRTHVDAEGRVDFKGIAKNSAALNQYIAWLAIYSPQSHPENFRSDQERLAYYLNSYNALAMYGVIQKGIPEDFDGFFKRLNFFLLTDYTIGGEQKSLYSYENDLIRKLGDPRVHFALNCMSVGCPRLLQTPYEPEILEKQLNEAATEFFNSDAYVRVDDTEKVARVSQILEFFTEDFVNDKQSASIVAYVNKYRRTKIPTNYAVEFIPYDWTVDTQ